MNVGARLSALSQRSRCSKTCIIFLHSELLQPKNRPSTTAASGLQRLRLVLQRSPRLPMPALSLARIVKGLPVREALRHSRAWNLLGWAFDKHPTPRGNHFARGLLFSGMQAGKCTPAGSRSATRETCPTPETNTRHKPTRQGYRF